MTKTRLFLASLLSMMAFAPLSMATAQDLSACGDIQLSASAECTVIPPEAPECTVMCEELSFVAACEAQLYAECGAQCTGGISAECSGGCVAACEVDPGGFDCQGECMAGCFGECEAACAAEGDSAGCMARCEGHCSAGCNIECQATPPSASCEAKCDAQCKVRNDLACEVSCQADGFAQCEVSLQGGCEAQCTPGMPGVLMCSNEYVDPRESIDACARALEAALNINVDGYAEGSASCDGGSCSAEGEASVSCAVADPAAGGNKGRGVLLGGALAAAALALYRRRRNK